MNKISNKTIVKFFLKYPQGLNSLDLCNLLNLDENHKRRIKRKLRNLVIYGKIRREIVFQNSNLNTIYKACNFPEIEKVDYPIGDYSKRIYDNHILSSLEKRNKGITAEKLFKKELSIELFKERIEYLTNTMQIKYQINKSGEVLYFFNSWYPLINNDEIKNSKSNYIGVIDFPNLINSCRFRTQNKIRNQKNDRKIRIKPDIFTIKDFDNILQKYFWSYLNKLHKCIFFTTPYHKYTKFNIYLKKLSQKPQFKGKIIIKEFAEYNKNGTFKDIDSKMIKFLQKLNNEKEFEKFIIFTGDQHFLKALTQCINNNVKVHVIAHKYSLSFMLVDFLEVLGNYKNLMFTHQLINEKDYVED